MTEGEFRLAYVPGVTPAKWAGVWAERVRDVPLRLVQVPAADIVPLLRKGDVDAAFVRLPVDREALHVIPLYLETTVVVVPKDHAVAAAEEVELADLADEDVFEPLDEVLTWDERPGQRPSPVPSTPLRRSSWWRRGPAPCCSRSLWPASTTAETSPTAR
ncbi:substrate-binding domain-containing protein [Actinomadura luteofluorescens]|uniref:substrate-binding domain-containing protein n=1 Tax=Actinomadura luteofluorescens TaxID=46163 RepID=UPI003633E024